MAPKKKAPGDGATNQKWEQFTSLKEGFDKHANQFGYVNVTDAKAMKSIANYLGLSHDVVSKEMKSIDFDANDLVSFAEFALWADRHTVGLPLGLGPSIPDKREWRKGIPDYWTGLPPPIAEEADLEPPPAADGGPRAAKKQKTGPIAAVAPDPDTSELEAFISAAKDFEWHKVWEILGRHPGYVNMRPEYRRYSAIHQAAYQGDVAVLRRYVQEFKGDPALPTKDGESPEQVALENGHGDAAVFLEEACKAAVAAGSDTCVKREGLGHDPEQIAAANEIIEKAKWEQWDEMFALIKLHPGCENLRPELRRFGAIHQVAFAGKADIMRRLVEGKADPQLLTRDKQTALQVAKDQSHGKLAKYLASLDKVSVKAGDDLIQAAHLAIDAAKEGKWERTFELLDKSPDLVNTRPDVRQYSVFHQAAYHGDIEVMRRLIEDYKANIKQLTKDGQSALQVALAAKKEAAAKYLEACTPTIKLEDDFITYPEQTFVKIEDKAILSKFQSLLAKTHKKDCNWTRDRDHAGGFFEFKTPVPSGYDLAGVVRNENPALWRIYQVSREITRSECSKIKKGLKWESWKPMTMENGLDWSDLGLEATANEWLLLHASLPEALCAIARTGFTMAKLGSGGTTGGGGLYGAGTYFADSITKADEYARRKVEKGEFSGCRAVALCRVVGGRHYYTDADVKEADKPKFQKRVFEGHYNSTVGDRLKLKNSFREYVIYDSSATYLEYILYYRRKGVPAKHI